MTEFIKLMDTYLVILFFEKCFITFNTLYCETLLVYMQTITYICNCNIYILKAADGKDKGKGGKDKPKSAGKGKGGGKKTPEPPSAKEGSKLRKRGEEDDEGKYIGIEGIPYQYIKNPKTHILIFMYWLV